MPWCRQRLDRAGFRNAAARAVPARRGVPGRYEPVELTTIVRQRECGRLQFPFNGETRLGGMAHQQRGEPMEAAEAEQLSEQRSLPAAIGGSGQTYSSSCGPSAGIFRPHDRSRPPRARPAIHQPWSTRTSHAPSPTRPCCDHGRTHRKVTIAPIPLERLDHPVRLLGAPMGLFRTGRDTPVGQRLQPVACRRRPGLDLPHVAMRRGVARECDLTVPDGRGGVRHSRGRRDRWLDFGPVRQLEDADPAAGVPTQVRAARRRRPPVPRPCSSVASARSART